MIASRESIGADGDGAAAPSGIERAPNGCWVSLRNVVLGLGCLAAIGVAIPAACTLLCTTPGSVLVDFENRSNGTVTAIAFDSSGTSVGTLEDLPAGGHASICVWPEFERPLSVSFLDASGQSHHADIDEYFLISSIDHVVVFDGEHVEILTR